MIFYVLIYLTIFAFGIISIKNELIRNIFTWLIILSLSVLTAIRDGIGTDYENYVLLYDLAPTFNQFSNNDVIYTEPLFFILCVICKSFNLGVVGLFLITSLLASVVLLKVARKFSPKYIIIIFLLYFVFYWGRFQLNTIRHGLMVSFIWLAFSYIPERNMFKYIISIIIASSFHILGVFFFPFYWLLNKNFKAKHMYLLLFFAFLIGYFSPPFDLLLSLFPKTSIFHEKINYYYSDYYDNISSNASLGISLGFLLNLFILIISNTTKIKIHLSEHKYGSIITNSLFFGMFFYLLFNQLGVFVERISSNFYLSLIFLLPLLLSITAKVYKAGKDIIILLFIIYTVLILFKNYTVKELDGNYQYIPYKTILNI